MDIYEQKYNRNWVLTYCPTNRAEKCRMFSGLQSDAFPHRSTSALLGCNPMEVTGSVHTSLVQKTEGGHRGGFSRHLLPSPISGQEHPSDPLLVLLHFIPHKFYISAQKSSVENWEEYLRIYESIVQKYLFTWGFHASVIVL